MLSEPSLGLAGVYPFFCADCTVSLDLPWALRPGYQETNLCCGFLPGKPLASQSAHGDSSVIGRTQLELSLKGMAALLSRCVWVWEMAPHCPEEDAEAQSPLGMWLIAAGVGLSLPLSY